MTETVINAIGWLGFLFCTVAYLLLNVRILRFDGVLYQALNVIGGVGLVVSAFYFADTPNLAANAMWVLIALFGVIRYGRELVALRKRKRIGDAE